MKLLTTQSTPAEVVEAVNALTIRAADPLEPYHRLLSWVEPAALRALVVSAIRLPCPSTWSVDHRWRPLEWSASLGSGAVHTLPPDADPKALWWSRLNYVLFLSTPSAELLRAIVLYAMREGSEGRHVEVEWAPGVERPSVATTEPDATSRTVRIREADGTWRAAPYNDLRAGMVFELFEPDGIPANGGGWWLALSDVADDAVGTIRCEPAPEMSPEWLPAHPGGTTLEEKFVAIARELADEIAKEPRSVLLVVPAGFDEAGHRNLFLAIPPERWRVTAGVLTGISPNGAEVRFLHAPFRAFQIEGLRVDVVVLLAPLSAEERGWVLARLAGSADGRIVDLSGDGDQPDPAAS